MGVNNDISILSDAKRAELMAEFESESTKDGRKVEVAQQLSASDTAEVVNSHTQFLQETADRDIPWNIERAQVLTEVKDVAYELERVEKRYQLPGIKNTGVKDVVQFGAKIFYENAKSAYKDTLYLNELFDEKDFLKNVTKELSVEEVAGNSIAAGGIVAALGGGWYAPAMLAAPEYAVALGTFAAGAASAVGIGYSVYQAGDFLYMKATNPDMQTFPKD